MNEYIRRTAPFENATMFGRTDAWRDGYMAAFYGRGNEAIDGKTQEYITEFYKGFQHLSRIMHMNYRVNLHRYEKG